MSDLNTSSPHSSGAGAASLFNLDLIKKYDQAGPRYTSYPTAPMFHEGINGAVYAETLKKAGEADGPLSIYIHITGNAAVKDKHISDLDDHMLDLRIRHGRHVDREGRESIKALSSDNVQDIISYLRTQTK